MQIKMYVTLEEYKLRCELKYITNENDKAKLKQYHKECAAIYKYKAYSSTSINSRDILS